VEIKKISVGDRNSSNIRNLGISFSFKFKINRSAVRGQDIFYSKFSVYLSDEEMKRSAVMD